MFPMIANLFQVKTKNSVMLTPDEENLAENGVKNKNGSLKNSSSDVKTRDSNSPNYYHPWKTDKVVDYLKHFCLFNTILFTVDV